MKRILSLLVVFLTVVSAAFADTNLLSGEFSVSALKKVQFTKGNLYYNSTSATYSIAANQTDYETKWNADKVDHFYYSKTASVAYASAYSESNTRWDDELFCGQFGKLAPLTIGDDTHLYALMATEWTYLFTKRTNAANLIKWGVTVTNGDDTYNNCIIIAPDNYDFTTTPLAASYTLADVNSLGLVCLPAAGYRSSGTFNDTNSKGNYWANTAHCIDAGGAQYVTTDESGVKEDDTAGRKKGCTIRLVKTVAFTATTSGSTATVGTYTDLVTALGNSSVKTIIVSEAIQLPAGTTLDGQGKTIQVQTPYCTAAGTVDPDYDWYNVFTVNSGTVTLKNMTIYGGYFGDIYSAGGIRVLSGGFLNLENVTVARSGRGIHIAYNLGGSASKAVLKNCRIVRNVAPFGAGIVNAVGILLMDNCSFSENRTTRIQNGGGGGAMENKGGTTYINNTVIANNCSNEIGGAINNNNGTLYLTDCTISGNVTTVNAQNGGGIGSQGYYGKIYAVNTIIMNNYYISKDGNTITPSDIGFNSNKAIKGEVNLYNCLYGKGGIQDGEKTDGTKAYTCTNCVDASQTDAVFASYRTDGILSEESGTTAGFKHPVLAHISSNIYGLYAPPGDFSKTGGVKTYFSYTTNLSTVNIGYGDEGSITTLLGSPAAANLVTTYYEGGARSDVSYGQIGASGPTTTVTYYTVKLSSDLINGAVTGATTYGDSYPSGTSVTVTVTPSNGCSFMCWNENHSDEAVLSSSNPYTFTVTRDITLYPSIKLVVKDGTDFELPSTLEGVETKVVDAAEYTRNLGDNTWGTLCLPFTFKVDNTKFKCYKLASVDLTKGIMQFTEITNGSEVAAGTPVIVKQAKSTDDVTTTVLSSGNATGSKVKVVDATTPTVQDDDAWTLYGTLKLMYLTKDDNQEYYFFNGDKFWYTNFPKFPHYVTIPAYRSYFTTTGSAAKASFTLEAIDDDIATEIGTVDAEGKVTFFDGPAYNLTGQRISKSSKGIMIINGKKVIVR